MVNFNRIVRPNQIPIVAPPRVVLSSKGSGSGGPQQLSIGGTATNGDQIALVITSAAILGSPVTITFTLGGGDTLVTAAVGLVNAINANGGLQAAGISATIVPSQPTQVTVSQPTTLNPQATFIATSTGTTTLTMTSGNVQISPGKRGTVKTFNGSASGTTTVYSIKYPREKSSTEVNAAMRNALNLEIINLRGL